jgi:predicted Rossmann-fold nucleotide-binding protein
VHVKEIESLEAFDQAVADGLADLRGWHLQSVDLTGRGYELSRISVCGGVFLGCRFAPGVEEDVRRRGGLVFPTVPDVPFDPYRGALYSPDDLYDGLEDGYAGTPDATSYAWSRLPRSLDRTLAAALHDHAIDDALVDATESLDLVGVLGGHALRRDEPGYRAAAVLGRDLAGFCGVATGGGPGAMEAANLGAWMSSHDASALDDALAVLAAAPSFADDVDGWARAAFTVRERWPDGAWSLGIPTWFYGHEPPNAFAAGIAKYFSNATREDVLLKTCRAGLVFLPGAAGTVQEIFQASTAGYYADAAGQVPMVLVGRRHWTEQVDAWGLLRSLAAGRPFAAALHLVDDPQDVLPLLEDLRRDRG